MESMKDTSLLEEGKFEHVYLHGTVTVKRPLSTFEKIQVWLFSICIGLTVLVGGIASIVEESK